MEEEEVVVVEEEDIPCDTWACLLLLRREFPRKATTCAFVMKSHIYSVLSDRTEVDRELNRIARRGMVRLVKLASGSTDYAVIMWDDYLAAIEDARDKWSGRVTDDILGIFDWFARSVARPVFQCHIDEGDLHQRIAAFLREHGGAVCVEDCTTLLVRGGFLTRRLVGQGSYWFALPDMGQVVKQIRQGRKHLEGVLGRRKRREMLQWDLEKCKFQRGAGSFPSKFFIRDALGNLTVDQIPTTCGPLLRLADSRL